MEYEPFSLLFENSYFYKIVNAYSKCFSKRRRKPFDEGGFTIEIVLIAEGDNVIEQTSKSETTYEVLGVNNAEEAEEMLAEFLVGYDSTEGVTHQIDYQDDRIVETVTVNYETVDVNEMSELAGSFVEGDPSQGVSLKMTVEMMQEMGYKIVD